MPYAVYVKPLGKKKFVRYDLGTGEHTYSKKWGGDAQAVRILKRSARYFSDAKVVWVKK